MSQKPFSLRAWAWAYDCDADWVPDGENWVTIWEPLDLPRPDELQPLREVRARWRVFSDDEIELYDAHGVVATCCCHSGNYTFPFLLRLSDGLWYEVMPRKIVLRTGAWFVRWRAAKNTRIAQIFNEASKK